MYVTKVELTNFRNYEHASIEFAPGANLLIGTNGQGKTNIVEAIAYLATLASHRVAADGPLVKVGEDQAVIQARVIAGLQDARALTLELTINPGRANQARINRSPQRRARDLMGALRVVAFTPDDLAIVKGDPNDRRVAIDEVVVQRWPRIIGVKADYDRVLRQRNALLKTMCDRPGRQAPGMDDTLDIWDGQLAPLGAELMVARARTVADMRPLMAQAYQAIAPVQNQADAVYAPRQPEVRDHLANVTSTDEDPAQSVRQIGDLLRQAMVDRHQEEIRRGVSLIGPHRDDIELAIHELPAKGYASHGESWSLALSWRLASLWLLRQDGGEPVLILDDVFSELDDIRRDRLTSSIEGAEQVLITAAVPDDVPASLRGRRFTVQAGTVSANGEP